MVNKESQAGRDFVLFKRQLYQMYEVKNRSIWEHEQFSLTVERRNLKWLHDANHDYIHELAMVNQLDQLADTGALGGKIFKKKLMNESKVHGLGYLGLSAFGYMKLTSLSLMMGGPLLPSLAVAGAAMMGLNQFSERSVITSITPKDEGVLEITYMITPLKSATITCHANDCFALCAVGDDDLGADDVESNVLAIDKHQVGDEHVNAPLTLVLPADAYRDRAMMEWIMAKKVSA